MMEWICKIFGHKFYRVEPVSRYSKVDHWKYCRRCAHIEKIYKQGE